MRFKYPRPPARRLALFACCALWLLAGCGSARVAEPLTAGALGGNDPHERMEFWYQLARRPVVSNDEAFHALLLYLADADPAADYPGRVREMRRRGMLADDFDRPAAEAVDRGTLAVAVVRALGIRGGVSMQLFGPGPRYATRALQYRNLYPPGSPNQAFTGAQFVAVMGRVEDWQRGDPADAPAALLPGEIRRGGENPAGGPPGEASPDPAAPDESPARPLMLSVVNVLNTSAEFWWQDATQPAASQPVPTKDRPAKLKAVITGIEGDLVEVRKSPADNWVKARVGLSLGEAGEFRTGPKSAVRFVVPPDQVYTLDRQGTCTVLQAVYDGKKVTADVGMQQGRVRLDVAPIARPLPPPAGADDEPYKIQAAGVEHGIVIHSPNATLAVRGTVVSLYDEPGFAPEAVSLTGRAVYRNTRRQLVAFGGGAKAAVRGAQAGAAEQALTAGTALPNPEVAANDFGLQQTTLLLGRGGRRLGDVLVGNSRVTDAQLVPALPGALDFVLRWDGGPARKLNDLNLLVFSPQNTTAAPDFVGNPPFALSLTPGDPAAERTRAALYPRASRTGGMISGNHVGPEGLEFAAWPKNYPAGNYRVVVYNLLDAVPAPAETVNPVPYTLDVFLNKRVLIGTVTGSVGELQTSPPVVVPVPAATASAAAVARPGKGGGQGRK